MPRDKKASPPAHPKRRAEGEVSRIKRSVYELVATGYDIPVDDSPEILDVVSTTVLVAQVVSVLPYVDTEERTEALDDRVATVRLLRDDEFAVSLSSEPSPARTEERGASP